MTSDFNKGARVFLLCIGDTVIGFNSILNLPNASLKYAFRTHRLVILPDYQNLGIGTKFEEFIGEYLLKQSNRLFLRTSHLRLGIHCEQSDLWKTNTTNKKIRKNKNTVTNSQTKKYKNIDFKRSAYSFEYVGKDYNLKEHQNIVCIGECDERLAEILLLSIVDHNKFISVVTGVAKQSEETNTVWEKVAKKYSYRIEIAHISGVINGAFVKNPFDCVCIGKDALNELMPYKDKMCRYVVYDKNRIFQNVLDF